MLLEKWSIISLFSLSSKWNVAEANLAISNVSEALLLKLWDILLSERLVKVEKLNETLQKITYLRIRSR